MIACAWVVYANTVGASMYPSVGEGPADQVQSSERLNFAARFEPLAAAATSAPQMLAHLALKAAMKRHQDKPVQVASADPNDVPTTAGTQNAEPTKTGHRYYALLDANYSFGFAPDRFKRSSQNSNAADAADVPEQSAAKVAVAPQPVKLALATPLPPEKKSATAAPAAAKPGPTRNPFGHESLVARAKNAIMLAAQHRPNFFEKLFGKTDSPALAYASADGDVSGAEIRDANLFDPSDDDHTTAVYDISAKVVYMPDGSKLEAHSGLGSRLDDPKSANVRMQGVTPPHIYDLKLREALFHGVAAIRLTPVGGSDVIYGRDGLLAHTFMLGPRGDSNGCVSFRNYEAFLQAFKRGEIKRLVVVGSLSA